uniref:Uncharacterized protein n=1 Tax=Plectus sambesii TaxID=2011161 RepID=A0A914WDG3_9BILA
MGVVRCGATVRQNANPPGKLASWTVSPNDEVLNYTTYYLTTQVAMPLPRHTAALRHKVVDGIEDTAERGGHSLKPNGRWRMSALSYTTTTSRRSRPARRAFVRLRTGVFVPSKLENGADPPLFCRLARHAALRDLRWSIRAETPRRPHQHRRRSGFVRAATNSRIPTIAQAFFRRPITARTTPSVSRPLIRRCFTD